MAQHIEVVGRNLWRVWDVSYNADPNREATRVRFSHRDKWVGDDYWRLVDEYQPETHARAHRALSHFERRGRGRSIWADVARAILYARISTQPAGEHLARLRRGRVFPKVFKESSKKVDNNL